MIERSAAPTYWDDYFAIQQQSNLRLWITGLGQSKTSSTRFLMPQVTTVFQR